MQRPELSKPLQKYLELLDVDAGRLLESYARPIPEAFRVNTLKTNDKAVISALEGRGYVLKRIPWTQHGYAVEHGNDRLSTSLEATSGLIYIQGPVSMAVPEVLGPVCGESVLDMCAAPGSKSTQILQMLGGIRDSTCTGRVSLIRVLGSEGELVANEPSARARSLVHNLKNSGATNYRITNINGRSMYRKYSGRFDRVLIDAPCSGLGAVSKDWTIARDWKPVHSRRLAQIQAGLLYSGYRCLKPGGVLVYSTCTFTFEENEDVVRKLLKKYDARMMDIDLNELPHRGGITEWGGRKFPPELAKCIRIYPYDSGAEGFFIAKIMKPETAVE